MYRTDWSARIDIINGVSYKVVKHSEQQNNRLIKFAHESALSIFNKFMMFNSVIIYICERFMNFR